MAAQKIRIRLKAYDHDAIDRAAREIDGIGFKTADRIAINLGFANDAPPRLDAGIVYATDAAIDPGVRIVDTFPATTHLPIIYPAARLAAGDPAASDFIAFLRGPAARGVFERYGFTVPR